MLLIYLSMLDNQEDKNKFTLLYEKYRKIMFYIANQILNDEYSAEDALHDAFEIVIKNLHNISEIDCPQTKNYLIIIVKQV